MTIKKLQKLCHQIAKEKGFWSEECENCNGLGFYFCGVYSNIRLKKQCCVCNGRGQLPKDRNNGEMIALMHSELSEVLEELRKGNLKKVGSELADCVIRILDYCGGRNIDLEKEILKKIKINKKRPYKHNKEF